MNKNEFIKHIATENKCLQKEAEIILNMVLEGIKTALKTENEIAIVGWGRFYKRIMPARKGRNPQTGEDMQLQEYMKVGLKAGKGLIEAASLALKPPAKKKTKKKS